MNGHKCYYTISKIYLYFCYRQVLYICLHKKVDGKESFVRTGSLNSLNSF